MKIKLTVLSVTIFILYALYSNVYFLSSVACRYGNMSSTYEFLLERIYKIISSDEEADYLEHLNKEGDKYFYSTWLRILAVSGVNNIDNYIYNALNEVKSSNDYDEYNYYYLNNVGVANSLISIPLLKDILDSDDRDGLSKSLSAHSIYLLEGTKPSIENDYYFLISEKQFLAREVIQNSRGRRRTYDEMITIDQLYRRTEIIVHEE